MGGAVVVGNKKPGMSVTYLVCESPTEEPADLKRVTAPVVEARALAA